MPGDKAQEDDGSPERLRLRILIPRVVLDGTRVTLMGYFLMQNQKRTRVKEPFTETRGNSKEILGH